MIDGEPLTHEIRIEFVTKPAISFDAQMRTLISLGETNNQLLQELISYQKPAPPPHQE